RTFGQCPLLLLHGHGAAPLEIRRSATGCRAVRDSTLVAWYRCLDAPRTGGAYDSHHRTAGIAGRTRRRGGRVAARGARAAADPSHYWHLVAALRDDSSAEHPGFSARNAESRLFGRTRYHF